MNEDRVSSGGRAARDRARGALVGLACGDAVGTTVEFSPPGSFPLLTDMVGGGPFCLRPGEWTDDTSMALCMAESIVDTASLDLADHHRRYLAWRDDGYLSSNGRRFDIGITVSSQLSRFETSSVPIDPAPNQGSAANGSLMRLAPAAIAWHAELEVAAEMSGESSKTTHPARRPVDGCRLLGAMIAALINGVPAAEVFDASFWKWGDLDVEIAAIATGSYRHKSPPEIRGTGFCVDALEAAMWAVHGATDFRDAVLRAANLGDDADTTAAIAGQLAGACWGAEAIPDAWRAALAMHDRIVSLADALFDLHPTPAVAERSWLHDNIVHAWWVEPGRVLAGEYPSTPHADPAKLQVLLDAGIRTFVDLTTPTEHLAPYRQSLMDIATQRGLNVRYEPYPIPDLGTVELDGYRDIVNLVRSEVASSRPVYVHCWGGVGRTGTVAGCLLPRHNLGVDEVIGRIEVLRRTTRKAHRRCPETNEQLAVVAAWHDRGDSVEFTPPDSTNPDR